MPYKLLADKRRHDKAYVEKRKEEQSGLVSAPFQRQMVKIKVPNTPKHGLRIAVIPDVQIRPGVPMDHLTWAGKYIARKQPDVIVQIGDFSDILSLSSHDQKGSLRLEGTRYKKDLDSTQRAMNLLMDEIVDVPGYHPVLILCYGNHEYRITRAVESDPKWQGMVSIDDLGYESFGWKVFPFLQPVTLGGVAFCHYFPSGVKGLPVGSAKALLTKLHMSAYAGHQQGRDIAYSKRADGTDMTAIISGSFYQHAEEYLTPFTNNHWRGLYFLHEVKDGSFDEMAVSMSYLKRKFKK